MKSLLKTLAVIMAALFLHGCAMNTSKENQINDENAKIRILVLCTGNTCRSQMAHGFLDSYGDDLDVHSGGVKAEEHVNPKAIEVMKEVGIDISDHTPQQIDQYLDQDWDYVITVCDHANETCPVFNGNVKHRLHMGFEDPSKVTEGTDEFKMNEYRRIRDDINKAFRQLYDEMEERQ